MRLSAATFLVAVAALVGGCGGSSPTATSDATATSSTRALSGSRPGAVAGSSTATAKPRFFASIVNCERVERIGARFVLALRAGIRHNKLNVKKTGDALQALARSAPSAIRRDFQLLADKYHKLTAVLTASVSTQGATPTASQVEGISAAVREFGVAQRRAEHLVAWLRQNCDGA
jgi:hypothetical protein